MNIQYHSQVPENNNPDGFTEFQNLDWVVQVGGRKMLRNSVRVVGDVEIDIDGGSNPMVLTTSILVDNKVGHHSYFQLTPDPPLASCFRPRLSSQLMYVLFRVN